MAEGWRHSVGSSSEHETWCRWVAGGTAPFLEVSHVCALERMRQKLWASHRGKLCSPGGTTARRSTGRAPRRLRQCRGGYRASDDYFPPLQSRTARTGYLHSAGARKSVPIHERHHFIPGLLTPRSPQNVLMFSPLPACSATIFCNACGWPDGGAFSNSGLNGRQTRIRSSIWQPPPTRSAGAHRAGPRARGRDARCPRAGRVDLGGREGRVAGGRVTVGWKLRGCPCPRG